ncbi:MAG: LysM peptidoglycan-binding domain-containing protein [Halobacteriovoraceae bacterium]|jgi:nucleoid-associated protein YgaU|nr:LysM peptidoglycan-binding domain-containing protein [Halobacteriovoraceae bacterium]
MKVLLSIFLIMSLVACSGSKSANKADGTDESTELAENDEFTEDFSEDDGEEEDLADTDSSEDEPAAEETVEDAVADAAEETPEEVADVEEEPAAVDQESEMRMAETQPVQIQTAGESGFHTVAKNETLMIIAFKKYGDYEKWRDLARWNADKLGSNFTITEGMQLKFEKPAQKFVWSPEGNPYLIKVGDTLGIISNDTYGTQKYWKNIWHNNKPLIKNPNKIFAGFTIFTPIIEGREVANEDI